MVASRPVCVITGGTAGIGLAIAERFASLGYDVAICGRNAIRMRSAQEKLRAYDRSTLFSKLTDIGIRDEAVAFIRQSHDRFGRIDVLVNNAGFAALASADELSDADFNASLRVALLQLATSSVLFRKM